MLSAENFTQSAKSEQDRFAAIFFFFFTKETIFAFLHSKSLLKMDLL